MGEVNVPVKDDGKPARKKHSTKVDLTPMVDLGFLLITFFIFTTKMEEPRGLDLKLPKDTTDKPNLTAESKTLNIILGDNNRIWYYHGNDLETISASDYANGIRHVIQTKKKVVDQSSAKQNEMVVLIKPTTFSSYENLVDVLDEMLINNVTRYVLMEPSSNEIARVQ